MLGREIDFRAFDEEQWVKFCLAVSVVSHIIFFSVDQFKLFEDAEPIVAEWTMDTELLSESELGAVKETSLPKAKEAEEEAVPNLLPQLPKKFSLDQPEKIEETADPEEAEKAEAKEGKDEKSKEKNKTLNQEDESNKIAKNDALKRLALEKIRQQQKEASTEVKAQSADDVSRVRDKLADMESGSAKSPGLGAAREATLYGAKLYKAIRRQYSIPETFKASGAKLKVILQLRVNGRGQLDLLEVYESSGDPVFDEYTLQAAKNAAPFEPPPETQAGKNIHVQFSL
ncbi:MAG: cell envelope integrity protein TolA [Oligoflexales bacterium]